jgi:superoxide dismutase
LLLCCVLSEVVDEEKAKLDLFNYASQVYNHTFFLMNLQPGGVAPSPWMADQLAQHFGSIERFEQQFVMVRTVEERMKYRWV